MTKHRHKRLLILGNGITSSIPNAPIPPSTTESVSTISPSTAVVTPNIVPSTLSPHRQVSSWQPTKNQSSQSNILSKNIDYITGISTYTGSGIKAFLEFPNMNGTAAGTLLSKQIIELTTISVSVHRVKSPAVAMGFINPKGFGRGRRTIGGTMIFNKFTKDVLSEFLTSDAFTSDLSKDTDYSKVDQLPAFNLTLLFCDEYGNSSYQRLLGVELLTSGDVYSIQEMLSEQTITFICTDFTPLLPISQAASSGGKVTSPTYLVTSTQATPGSVINANTTPVKTSTLESSSSPYFYNQPTYDYI